MDQLPGKAGKNSDAVERFDETLLGVLNVVERDPQTSQRVISRELGVALGLANAYLKRCVRKGFIKISQVPKRRYAYYLTPQGFAEKARLTGEYLSSSLSFFRTAREQMSDILASCATSGYRRVALAGVSDLAEVGRLCAYDHKIELVGIVDASQAGTSFHGLPVFATLGAGKPVDAVIVTSLIKPELIYETLAQEIARERIFAPRLLRLKLPAVPIGKVVAE
ncbi:MAG: winged helix-turn-helix transcriptional regulator [Xanthobacteraceae bacterium]|nr:winged helix-turn-helix transcriptional regulator [Xanthobacteraceae bacterium]